MSTTIKISQENKQRLFQLKTTLEKERGENLSYDDAVEELLDKLEHLSHKELIRGLLSLKGTLSDEDKREFKKMREIEREREERFLSN